jgi:hypothetical protein
MLDFPIWEKPDGRRMRAGRGPRRPGSFAFIDNLVVVIGILKECRRMRANAFLTRSPKAKSEKISLILGVAGSSGYLSDDRRLWRDQIRNPE